MIVLKILLIIIVTSVPAVQLYRDWKHYDKRTKNYRRFTKALIIVLLSSAIGLAVLTVKDNYDSENSKRKLEEVAAGNKTIIQENERLKSSLAKNINELLETRRQLNEKADAQISSQREIISLNQTIAKDQREMSRLSQFVAGYHQSQDSYCYLNFTSFGGSTGLAQMVVVHQGKYPLFGVQLTIVDQDEFNRMGRLNQLASELAVQIPVLNIGDLAPKSAYLAPHGFRLPSTDSGNYNIEISGLHGRFHQLLKLRRVNGKWKIALRVQNDDGSRTLLERIEKDFPRDEAGQVIWR